MVCDCAPMHVTDKVVRAATRLNIWFVLVPPATTFMLQPDDVGVIRHVKAALRLRQEALKQSFSHGNGPTEEWVSCLLTVQHVMRTRSCSLSLNVVAFLAAGCGCRFFCKTCEVALSQKAMEQCNFQRQRRWLIFIPSLLRRSFGC